MRAREVPAGRLAGLADSRSGLSTEEAAARRGRFGENAIVVEERGGWIRILRDTLNDPMLWFLVGTGAIFAIVGQYTESLVLVAALLPLLGMDAYLHRRTRASTAGLSSRLAAAAVVLRDGSETRVAALDLVPGDLVLVEPGEPLPADGLFVRAAHVQVDESSLTGESFPVDKAAVGPVGDLDGGPVGAVHWGFAGTRVLTGQARLRVVYTGAETLYGEIVRAASAESRARTPLQSAVASLVTVLVVAAAFLCLALAWIRYEQGHGVVDALLSAVTLAVAALPEEFPVVLTFFLGVGVYRLARRQALVRRAVVVENIGRVTAILSDKTGTLTEGTLQLSHVVPEAGIGDARLRRLAGVASRRESRDPMDIAILGQEEGDGIERVATFPFTEDRRRETGVGRDDDALVAVAKGAPEAILSLCDIDAGARAHWMAKVEEFAATGHKVIACAWQTLPGQAWSGEEPQGGFTMAGLLCFEDPARDGVAESIAACRAAGIRVIMVTGDHPATAQAVAREIGLGGPAPRVIEGDAMQRRVDGGDTGFLESVDVVARAVPAQKLTLVRSLQARGEIVAVTGDGVNDVPALQAADIGIAMGERGTQSAREVAAIVLLDDNLRSIVRAIAEGRQLFSNLRLSFMYLLMIHLPLVLTAALIPLAGFPLLYLPVHVVWLELVIHPTALLVFQAGAGDGVLRPVERSPRLRFFSPRQWWLIVLTGTVVTLTVMVSYLRSLGIDADTNHARAMALVGLMLASAGITLGLKGFRGAAAWRVAGTVAGSALVMVQWQPVAGLLHLGPLHADDWWPLLAGTAAACALAWWAARTTTPRAAPGAPRDRPACAGLVEMPQSAPSDTCTSMSMTDEHGRDGATTTHEADALGLTGRLRAALWSERAVALTAGVPRLSARVALGVDGTFTHVTFAGGRLEVLETVPLLYPWDFAIRGTGRGWAGYWASVPEPGWHDLFALSKRGEMRFEGNLHPFLAHLQYFKDLLALPRSGVPR